MAPQYELVYFDMQGIAEPIRLLFAYGNIPFKDSRITKEEFAVNVKSTLPFGKLPLLKVDGKVLTQSLTICRYLARQLKLTGKDDFEAAQAESIVETFIDLKDVIHKAMQGNMEEAKVQFPYYFNKFDEIIKKNGGFLVGNQLTWADIYFTGVLPFVKKVYPGDFGKDYPNIAQMEVKVSALPGIKQWIEKRATS